MALRAPDAPSFPADAGQRRRLHNDAEFIIGTNPVLADTDGDGV